MTDLVPLRRLALLGALACTLLSANTAAAAPAGSSATAAEHSRMKSVRAQERYYATGSTEPASDPELMWAKAREKYYASYGEPEPIVAPVAPSPTDQTPWLTITLAAVAALGAASIAAIHRRRLRLRRRVTHPAI